MCACQSKDDNGEVLHRDFYETIWERFDYVYNKIEVKEATTFDLGLSISFTDAYVFDYISLVFTVFDAGGTPYRTRGYKFSVKDAEGQWKSQLIDGCYTFDLPINKALQINDPGSYRFQIENRMPKTPLTGVKSMTLYNNKP